MKQIPYFGIHSDIRYAEPQQVFHPQLVNTIYVIFHIFDFLFSDLPVPAISVAPVRIVRLPSIVHDHSSKSKLGRTPALCFDIFFRELLMIGIPERIHRISGLIRYKCRTKSTVCFPPVYRIPNRLLIPDVPVIQKNPDFVCRRFYRSGKNFHTTFHRSIFLMDSHIHIDFFLCF